jgi:thymidylate synthase ThyX
MASDQGRPIDAGGREGLALSVAAAESFTAEERARLAPYFTNVDAPVFALVNLPEVVKGALFARYSRSPKSLRRLFLDEFADAAAEGTAPARSVGTARAERLFERVFVEYGDDSVAQLGGVHLACEGVSNVLTKILEWGRLMAYLEQSTRYVPYADRPGGRWRYHVPAEVCGTPLEREFGAALDLMFETYARWLEPMQEHFRRRHPRQPPDSEVVYRNTIRAKALDTLRGLLPAATRSNVGLYGTGQAYEALLLRLRASPLAEARACADLMLTELRKVIPAFLRRVDTADRGGAWSDYLATTGAAAASAAAQALGPLAPEPRPEVVLADFDPEGETKVVAAALYAASGHPDDQLLALARRMTAEERAAVLRAYVGERRNRRHKPGRAFERTSYRFDILTDYGAFRDLQRHRLLTLEWQPLSTRHGHVTSEEIADAGALADWTRVMQESAALHDVLVGAGLAHVAPYAVSMAYRVRFYLAVNAREAMHMIELRTTPQGHPAYRRICQTMHRLIEEQAGHRAIAASMRYVDFSGGLGGRMDAERAAELRRAENP